MKSLLVSLFVLLSACASLTRGDDGQGSGTNAPPSGHPDAQVVVIHPDGPTVELPDAPTNTTVDAGSGSSCELECDCDSDCHNDDSCRAGVCEHHCHCDDDCDNNRSCHEGFCERHRD